MQLRLLLLVAVHAPHLLPLQLLELVLPNLLERVWLELRHAERCEHVPELVVAVDFVRPRAVELVVLVEALVEELVVADLVAPVSYQLHELGSLLLPRREGLVPPHNHQAVQWVLHHVLPLVRRESLHGLVIEVLLFLGHRRGLLLRRVVQGVRLPMVPLVLDKLSLLLSRGKGPHLASSEPSGSFGQGKQRGPVRDKEPRSRAWSLFAEDSQG
mmetsp:Transcript_27522/g.67958  ORF Transcript_27522/g.67958 Transcript_27522/m.67958 type:complete len:214 (+) Transcript_27522:415-1056(+)